MAKKIPQLWRKLGRILRVPRENLNEFGVKLQGRCLWKGFSSTIVLEGKFNWWCNFKVPSIVRCLDQNWPQWFGQKELLLLIQVRWFRRKKKLPAGSEITLYEDFYIDLIHIRVNVKERSVFFITIVFGWLGGRWGGWLCQNEIYLISPPPPLFPAIRLCNILTTPSLISNQLISIIPSFNSVDPLCSPLKTMWSPKTPQPPPPATS